MKVASAGLLLVAVAVGSACVSVKPVVLDKRTQLENQLLGRFAALERELILASSVRGAESDARPSLSPLQRELVEAQMNRAFNADDVEALKDARVVSEGRSALLVIVKAPTESAAARRARALVGEENKDRTTIFRGLIATSPELSEKDLPLLRRIFYELRARTARPGQLVEEADGRHLPVKRSSKSTSERKGGRR